MASVRQKKLAKKYASSFKSVRDLQREGRRHWRWALHIVMTIGLRRPRFNPKGTKMKSNSEFEAQRHQLHVAYKERLKRLLLAETKV